MSNHGNYYYNVVPFGLKNANAIYKQLMDAVFSNNIWYNLDIHIDEMVVNTFEGGNHAIDLEDILWSINNNNMFLNPTNGSFGIQVEKFLRFIFTKWGIVVNPINAKTT